MLVVHGIRNDNVTMARNLDLDLVRTFVAVAEHGSMTAAGQARHLTQGAVSQQVKRLEEGLGCRLFERGRAGLRLTVPGLQLLSRGKRLLSLNDEIWSELAVGGLAGPVCLGVPYDLVATCVVPLLKPYAEAHPLVETSLVSGASPDLLAALARGEIDLALVEEPVGPSSGACLRVERLVWVGARQGGAHRRTPLPVSLVAESCAFRPAVLKALAGQERVWRTVFENGSIDATTATVRADLAVTTWLACTVPADLDILGAADGLPELPPFAINLHLPKRTCPVQVTELAHHLQDGLTRWQPVA